MAKYYKQKRRCSNCGETTNWYGLLFDEKTDKKIPFCEDCLNPSNYEDDFRW